MSLMDLDWNDVALIKEALQNLKGRDDAEVARAKMDGYVAPDSKRRSRLASELLIRVERKLVELEAVNQLAPISRIPYVCGGRACFTGTRIPMWIIASLWEGGVSDANILKMHPRLKKKDLELARDYIAAHKSEIEADKKDNSEE